MLTLGIETSCDETSCAILKDSDIILSNVVSSSLRRHRPFGGVVPEIASRHCLEQIDLVFNEALARAGIKPKDIGLIAVTNGPGLVGSLLVGVSFAKALSYQLGVPLVGVNHLEAHLVANFIRNAGDPVPGPGKKKPERFVGLLVSGGHTLLVAGERGRLTVLGETVDDAAGEAYDKVAKMLGLGYPGGPVIDKLAKKGNPEAIRFTKPKQDNRFDFSFSGIKTAVLYGIRDRRARGRGLDLNFKRDVAASFQHAVVSWLVDKTLDAAAFKQVQDVVVGGGVSANSELRKRLGEEGRRLEIRVWFPPLALTNDNAAMIARRGNDLYREGCVSSNELTADPNLSIV